MSITDEEIKDALKAVKYPGFTRDIVSFGLVKGVKIDNGDVSVQLALATNDPSIPATIKNDAEKILRDINGIRSAKVLIDIHAPPAGAGAGVGATRIPGIKHVIAIGPSCRSRNFTAVPCPDHIRLTNASSEKYHKNDRLEVAVKG